MPIGQNNIWIPRVITNFDFNANDFIHDDTWHVNGLDLSGILPKGTKGVVLRVRVQSANTPRSLNISYDKDYIETQGIFITWWAGYWIEMFFVLPLDKDLKMDYLSNLTGVDGSTRLCSVAILGYFFPTSCLPAL